MKQSLRKALPFVLVFSFPLVGNAQADIDPTKPNYDADFRRAKKVAEGDLSKLPIDSAELRNVYKQFFNTSDASNDNFPPFDLRKGPPPRPSLPPEDWRSAARKDILRRGSAVQPVVEKIFLERGGTSHFLLQKISQFPDIDKRPFVVWVRETLDDGKYRNLNLLTVGKRALFIANYGSLDDLEFLDEMAEHLPLEIPPYVRALERRKKELAAAHSNAPEAKKDPAVKKDRGANSVTDDDAARDAKSIKLDSVSFQLLAVGLVAIVVLAFIRWKATGRSRGAE